MRKSLRLLTFVLALPLLLVALPGVAQDGGQDGAQDEASQAGDGAEAVAQSSVDLLLDVIPAANVLFASEMIGAVKSIDKSTGKYFDDTKVYMDAAEGLSDADRQQIFQDNALRVYPRLNHYVKV